MLRPVVLLAAVGLLAYAGAGRAADPAAAAGAAGEVQATLAKLRDTFASELARAEAEMAASDRSLHEGYAAALTALEKRLQGEAELDGVLAVHAESERFARDAGVTAATLVAAPASLRDLQQRFLAAGGQNAVQLARRVIGLATQYGQTLQALQERWTREGRVDDAVAVKAERDAIAACPQVTAAQFALADAEARLSAAAPTNAPAPAVATPAAAPRTLTPAGPRVSPRTQLDRRYRALCAAILARDWKTACGTVDPDYVKAKGEDVTTGVLRMSLYYLRFVDAVGENLKTGDIDLSDDGQEAVVTPRLWRNNQWTDLSPTEWLLRDGDWYLRLGEPRDVRAERGPDLAPKKRRRFRRLVD